MEIFLGEIRLMSFPQAPQGWAYCQGQTLTIAQNQALFALLGTQYGGDGVTTFQLPDLRGRVIVGQGRSPSGTAYAVGQVVGTEGVALTSAQMPTHAHGFVGTLNAGGNADSTSADGTYPANTADTPTLTPYASGGSSVSMGAALAGTLTAVGGSQPHENRQPFMALNYAIALQGIYPSRS